MKIKALLLAFLLAIPFAASAGFCDDVKTMPLPDLQEAYSLTDRGVAEAKEQCGRLPTAANASSGILPPMTPDATAKWGQVAKDFASAIGIAANELGMATNNFLNTPAGKITAALIAWKVMGDELAAFGAWFTEAIICLPIALLIGLTWRRWLTNQYKTATVYEYKPFLWGFWSRQVLVSKEVKGYATNSDGETVIVGTMCFMIPAGIIFLIGLL